VAEGSTTEGQDEALQEAAQETIDTAVAAGNHETTEGEDMGTNVLLFDGVVLWSLFLQFIVLSTTVLLSDWYWDELTYEYDDDMFEQEYWDYDWDSVWGEYA
jgi:hypothetical protein